MVMVNNITDGSEYKILVYFIGLIITFILYIAVAIFLNKLNKLIYGKGTPMAWIPIVNVYLLGKLTVNKVVGWLLIIGIILSGRIETEINGIETETTILPEKISEILSQVCSVVIFGLFVYAIIKYINLKKQASTQNTNLEVATTLEQNPISEMSVNPSQNINSNPEQNPNTEQNIDPNNPIP